MPIPVSQLIPSLSGGGGFYDEKQWIRNLLPGVSWDSANQSVVLPGGVGIKPTPEETATGRYSTTPGNILGSYATNQPQLTPETFKGYSDIATQLFQPLYESRSTQLANLLNSIKDQVGAQKTAVGAAYGQAQSNLQRQQQGDLERARSSAISRGTYSSGVYDEGQNQISRYYAPEYQQLQAKQAADMSLIAQQAAQASQDLAAQGKDLEAQFMSQVAQGALGLFGQEQQSRNQMFQNVLSLFDTRARSAQQVAQNSLVQQRLDFDRQDAEIRNEQETIKQAISRTQALGFVSPQDAGILGVDPFTPSSQAREAAADRQADLTYRQKQLSLQARQIELAGREKDTALEQTREFDLQQKQQETADQKAQDDAVKNYQAQYGVDRTTATHIYAVLDNPTRESAMADLQVNRNNVTKAGVNPTVLQRAIDEKWPPPTSGVAPKKSIWEWLMPLSYSRYNQAQGR